jgi:hypothetical protein
VKLGGTVVKIYPFHRWELGRTVEILWNKHKERRNHKRAAHHSIPAFIGENWVGLLKQRNHKEQHITQSLLIGEVGRTVENTLS